MSQALIEELNRENLCTHFILPLLKLNKGNFTQAGFVNCYLTQDKTRIAVEIAEPALLSRRVHIHPEYIGTFKNTNGNCLVVFRLLRKWDDHIRLFCEGKFSLFTKKNREAIIRYSGLPYRKVEGKRTVTDGRLLAINPVESGILRGAWEKHLFDENDRNGVASLPEELLSIPGEESYINPVSLPRIRDKEIAT